MVTRVEKPENPPLEITRETGAGSVEPAMRIRMLGPLTIEREGQPLELPASRKVRALFGYLAISPRPVARDRLCELLWDDPNDPRGELRWCLSKIRSFADTPGRRRLRTLDGTVRLDLDDCLVDASEVANALAAGVGVLPHARQQALCLLFRGEFLEGLETDRYPAFCGWLTAQRRHCRQWHTALLEQLASGSRGPEALSYLERWLELAPYDLRAHERMLQTLADQGQVFEGEAHLEAAGRRFDAAALDGTLLREAWRAARQATRCRTTATVRALPPDPGGQQDNVGQTAEAGQAREATPGAQPRRAAIAVMPFEDRSAAVDARGGSGDALAHDVITRLAKLRCLFVIAQGTVFALRERRISPREAGRLLDVDYVVSGSVRREAGRLAVSVELAETSAGRIVWAERFDKKPDETFRVLEEIGSCIVASVASEIEAVERNRAVLKPPGSLDAWEAHHRGLWHMYRFSKPENEQARGFFSAAVRLDPTFSRAYAGLSFTHWQNAFQGWTDRDAEADRAFETAGQSLMADDRDPAAHWAMGRAIWLRGHHEQAVAELERAVELSPNFALGHYTLAFVQSQRGDPIAAISSSDYSRHLSPFDPLLFGMLGARAMALVRLGRLEEAAAWAVKAAGRPNAHPHILAIAAFSLALAGRHEAALDYAGAIHRLLPGYGVDDFLDAFRFDADVAAVYRKGATRIGMG